MNIITSGIQKFSKALHYFFKYLKMYCKNPKVFSEYKMMLKNFDIIQEESRKRGFIVNKHDSQIFMDNTGGVTNFSKDYLYHAAWGTRVLMDKMPKKHVDIASSVYWVASISAIIPVDFYDFRPADITLNGLTCKAGNITELPLEDESVESISSLSVLEHIGLGRYGDPIDANGDLKAIEELKRVTKTGGWILVNVPLKNEATIKYNAHRAYNPEQFIEYFTDKCVLEEFAMIGYRELDKGYTVSPTKEQLARQDGEYYGCFLFKKL